MEETWLFKDRAEAIDAFENLWDSSSGWILAFTGFSGQGKTTLLNWIVEKKCQPYGIPSARISLGDGSDDLTSHFTLIIDQLRSLLPDKAYREYQQTRKSILARLESIRVSIEQTQEVHDSEWVNQSQVTDTSTIFQYYERQAARDLAEQWVSALGEIRQTEKLVFLIDNYDLYQQKTSQKEIAFFWSTLERVHYPVKCLRILVASREKILYTNTIQTLQTGLNRKNEFELGDFSSDDSNALMSDLGVKDTEFQQAVYSRLAHGHPLMTRMAAEAWLGTFGVINISKNIDFINRDEGIKWLYGRILDNLPEDMCKAVRWSALLREFNTEYIKVIVKVDLGSQYHKFTSFSFIRPRGDNWCCHPLVRLVQVDYLQQEELSECNKFHERAIDYFTSQGKTIEALYHLFMLNPQEAFDKWKGEINRASFQLNHSLWGKLIEIGLADELRLEPIKTAAVLYQDGLRQYFLDRYSQAQSQFKRSLSIYESCEDYQGEANRLKAGEANCIKAMGDIDNRQSKFGKARCQYETALSTYQSIGDRMGEANSIIALGDVYLYENNPSLALDKYEMALNIFQDYGDRNGIATCIWSVGKVFRDLSMPIQARAKFETALNIFREIGSTWGVVNCIKALGDIYLELWEPIQAREKFGDAKKLYQSLSSRLGTANCIRSLAVLDLAMSDLNKAQAGFDEALVIYRSIGFPSGEAKCLQRISILSYKKGKIDKALQLEQQARTISDELRNHN